MSCECPHEGFLNPDIKNLYHSELESPFVIHPPGKCECTNNLRLYNRGGKKLLLCSICTILGDKEEATQ